MMVPIYAINCELQAGGEQWQYTLQLLPLYSVISSTDTFLNMS